EAAQEAVIGVGGGQGRILDAAAFDCDILVLGVLDDAIRSVSAALAPRVSCRAAFHLSGALPARELEPFSAKGATLGSLHPLRPFSGAPNELWEGTFVAVEGDPAAVELGERIARALGAHGHRLAEEAKPRYHAAATLAAAGSLATVSLAARIWSRIGIPEDVARAALADLSSRETAAAVSRSFEEALTGAIARRDVGTVRAHRSALQGIPEALAAYRIMARETLERTRGRGKEDEIRAAVETDET
ncbi:MAG TPA: DUF2520 domain-containing protein, partial [Thermoanaerobaculia bacterium]|nr:DUF2520 domain-containing protein [Thermoanaerobaculia bacterium]